MPSHYRKTTFRCGIIIPHVLFLLPVLELAGLHWTWGFYASGRLDQQVAEYRKAGEPTTWQELIEPAVPDGDNAAIELQAALNAMDDASVNALEQAHLSFPLTKQNAAIVRRALDANRETLKQVQAASAKSSFDWHLKPAHPMIAIRMPHVGELSDLAHLLQAAAFDAHQTGDDAGAIRQVREMLRLVRGASRHPCLIGHLVNVGIVTLAGRTLEQIAPDLRIGPKPAGGDEVPPEQVKTLIAELLGPAEPRDSLRKAFYMERLCQIDGYRCMEDGLDIFSSEFFGIWGRGGYLPKPLILTSASLVADHTTQVMNFASEPNWPTCLAGLQALGHPSVQHPILGAYAFLLENSLNSVVDHHYRHLADRRLAAATLAIRWYAVDHNNKLPAKLDDLVPAYLPAVPLDPFAVGNKPLDYIAADNPRIYSVGENMSDDGGSSEPTEANHPTENPWAQMDVVVLLRPPR